MANGRGVHCMTDDEFIAFLDGFAAEKVGMEVKKLGLLHHANFATRDPDRPPICRKLSNDSQFL